MRLFKSDFDHCFGLRQCATVDGLDARKETGSSSCRASIRQEWFPEVGWQGIESGFSAKGNRSSSM